ncbi:MAG: hypothetical protein ACJKSS_02170 [Patescibacteria group bacterium UBA2103]
MEVSDLVSRDVDANQIENALTGITEFDSKAKVLIADKLGLDVKFLLEDYVTKDGAEEAFREIYEHKGIDLMGKSSDADSQDQDASPEPAREDSSAEVEDDSTEEESDSETIVVGGVEYDLTDKDVRVKIWTAANGLKGGTTADFIEALVALGVKRKVSWWSNLRYGNATVFRSEVEAIAEHLDVDVADLLGVSDPSQEAEVTSEEASEPESAEETTSEVPESEEELSSTKSMDEVDTEPAASENPPVEEKSEPVSEPEAEEVVVEAAADSEESTEPSEGFQDLFLRLETSPAEGVTTGQLLVVAREGRSTDSEWGKAWFTMTDQGVSAAERIDELLEEILGMEGPVRRVLLDRITEKTSKV